MHFWRWQDNMPLATSLKRKKFSHIRHNAEDSKEKKTNCSSLYFILNAIIIVINYVTHGCAEVLISL